MTLLSGSYLENEWSVCPSCTWRPPFDKKVQHQSKIGCEASANICGFSWQCDPMLRAVLARGTPDFCLSCSTETPMTSLDLFPVFGNLCCVCETCLLIVFDPIFNFQARRHESGHESDSSFWSTRFRGSPECQNFNHDLERCVAMKKMPVKLNWLACDIVLVYECHQVPCFVCSDVVTCYAQYRV